MLLSLFQPFQPILLAPFWCNDCTLSVAKMCWVSRKGTMESWEYFRNRNKTSSKRLKWSEVCVGWIDDSNCYATMEALGYQQGAYYFGELFCVQAWRAITGKCNNCNILPRIAIKTRISPKAINGIALGAGKNYKMLQYVRLVYNVWSPLPVEMQLCNQ